MLQQHTLSVCWTRYKDVCKEGPKKDYTNWESLADSRSAWKQELPSSLKKGEFALKETSEEKGRKRKESSLSNVHSTDDCFLSRLQPPLQVTHRTVQPHKKMLICRLDGCYLRGLTRLTDDNDVDHKIEKIWDLNGMNLSHWTVY